MKYILLILTSIISVLGANAQSPITDCSECSERLLTQSDIEGLDYNTLYILRNEIYARKGHVFPISFLNDYFIVQPWYKPTEGNPKIKLSNIEAENFKFLGLGMMNEIDRGEYAENTPSTSLSDEDIEKLFPPDKRVEMGLRPRITKTYQFEDKSGKYLWVLSERPYKDAANNKGVFNDDLKAIKYKIIPDSSEVVLLEVNSITDKIKEQEDAFLYTNEADISFLPKYTYIDDLDYDDLLEQVITFGTTQVDGYSDNRVSIYIFSRHLKAEIRIYNCAIESGLYIEVDRPFYSMPSKIRDNIILQMETMLIEGLCIYPKDWKDKMSKGMLNIK